MSDLDNDQPHGPSWRRRSVPRIVGTLYVVFFGLICWLLVFIFTKMFRRIAASHVSALAADHTQDGLFWGLISIYGVIIGVLATIALVFLEKRKVGVLILGGWAISVLAIPLLGLLIPDNLQNTPRSPGAGPGDTETCGSFYSPKSQTPECASSLSTVAKWTFGITATVVFIPAAWFVSDLMDGRPSTKTSGPAQLDDPEPAQAVHQSATGEGSNISISADHQSIAAWSVDTINMGDLPPPENNTDDDRG